MEYRRTRLVETIGQGAIRGQDADIDGHMKAWTDAGWELLTVTTVSRDVGQVSVEFFHNFFWMKAD